VSRRALVLFASMSLIWGIPYLFIRIAVAEISPATLVFARTAIGGAILLPVALTRSDLRPVLERWRWVVAFAAIEIGVPWVLLGSAEQQVTSSLAGLLVAGVPLVGTVIAAATGARERVGPSSLVGLLVGLGGVAAIVGVDVGSSNLAALLEIAVVVVGYALGPAILARRLGGLSSVGVMALSLSLCAIVYAPIAFIQRPTAVPSANALVAIAILGVICTAAAFLLFSALIGEIGPVRATVITYINPGVAGLLGVLVLNEPFSPVMVLGLALVIVGSALATRGSRRPTADASPVPGAAPAPTPEVDKSAA
jgi:drug/metabolite transporter (DMT)-like permease